jgi:hypothetical protein
MVAHDVEDIMVRRLRGHSATDVAAEVGLAWVLRNLVFRRLDGNLVPEVVSRISRLAIDRSGDKLVLGVDVARQAHGKSRPGPM